MCNVICKTFYILLDYKTCMQALRRATDPGIIEIVLVFHIVGGATMLGHCRSRRNDTGAVDDTTRVAETVAAMGANTEGLCCTLGNLQKNSH